MTEQRTPEQLLRDELEIAQTHLEKAATHALARYRASRGEAFHEAHRTLSAVQSVKEQVDRLLKEESHG